MTDERTLDADHQPLSERRERGIELLGLAGVTRIEQPLDVCRADTHPPGEFGLDREPGTKHNLKVWSWRRSFLTPDDNASSHPAWTL
jgi:hypothetical protein